MRLIGNKTKLLGEIEGLLLEQGIEGGTLIDIFSGSCSVAKLFKRRGYRVVANDNLPACYAQAVAWSAARLRTGNSPVAIEMYWGRRNSGN